jgi:hypothetical protein
MGADNEQSDFTMSRRRLLTALGLGSGALAAATLNIAPDARAAILADSSPASAGAPRVAGLHLQFGADASTKITVSWHTPQPVANPRVALGLLDGRLEGTAIAKPASYVDAKSSQTVYAWHAKLAGLDPNSVYMYAAVHDGAAPEFGTFRTAPRGRAAFTFTSFGDQGTPTVGKRFEPPAGGDAAETTIHQRQSRLSRGGRHDAWRRVDSSAVPPVQRRPMLRQPCRRPGSHLAGFLGEQFPQRAQPSLDALAWQSRERTRQRADRLPGLSDLFLGTGDGRADGCDARALVRASST